MAACPCSTSCSCVNTARTPVIRPQPIVFELTSEATGVTILKDSSPQATAADGKVTVVGPFAPGVTNVQFAYAVPYSTGSLTVEQTLPIPLGRVIVLAQKVADMRVTSAQMSEQREMPADGQTYVVGQGPGLRAGERLAFAFSNLPHEALWPRYTAVGLAVAILAVGWWSSSRAARGAGAKSQRTGSAREAARAALRRAHHARGAAPGGPRGPAAVRRAPGRARGGARAGVRGDRAAGGLSDGLRAQGSRLRQNLRPSFRSSCLSPEP